MKVNLNRQFTDPKGNAIPNVASIADQIGTVLFTYGNDANSPASPEKKYQAWKLSCAIAAATPDKEVEISTEDAALIKEAANKAFAAGLYGQVVDIVENN